MTNCGGCKLLQLYANKDCFSESVVCIFCKGLVKPNPDNDYEVEDDDRLPSLEKIEGSSENADTLILVCKHDWCSFNIKIKKTNGEAPNLKEKQTVLKRHETNCEKNKYQGKRFRRLVDKDGGQDSNKGRFISIEQHGMYDQNSIIQKTERLDD